MFCIVNRGVLSSKLINKLLQYYIKRLLLTLILRKPYQLLITFISGLVRRTYMFWICSLKDILFINTCSFTYYEDISIVDYFYFWIGKTVYLIFLMLSICASKEILLVSTCSFTYYEALSIVDYFNFWIGKS